MYCTPADIRLPKKRLVELTNEKAPSKGVIVKSKIVEAIKSAGTVIDLYLSAKYAVPLKKVPEPIKQICIDLSVYELYKGGGMELEDNEGLRTRYTNSTKLLQMIKDGDVKLGIQEEDKGSDFYAASMVSGGGAQFTLKSMESL